MANAWVCPFLNESATVQMMLLCKCSNNTITVFNKIIILKYEYLLNHNDIDIIPSLVTINTMLIW